MPRVWLVTGLMLVSLTIYPAFAPAESAATQPSKAAKAKATAGEKTAKEGSEIARLRLEGEVPESSEEISFFSGKRPSIQRQTSTTWVGRAQRS